MKLDWLLYAGGIAALLFVTGRWHENSELPEAPPPPGIGEMSLFAAFTPFSAGAIINLPVDDRKEMTGTGFAIAPGQWVVARHSVANCPHPFINIGGNLGVPFNASQAAADANTLDKAPYILVTTSGGGRPFGMVDPASVKPGVRGFMPGYPAGQPGEATARLIGTMVLEKSKRGERNETVLAWAQAGRTHGIKGDLNQMSGGPVLDDNSHLIGVTIKEKPRRGRIYTSTPQTLGALAGTAQGKPDFESEAVITKTNYGIVADTLRREYRVVQVGCIKS